MYNYKCNQNIKAQIKLLYVNLMFSEIPLLIYILGFI